MTKTITLKKTQLSQEVGESYKELKPMLDKVRFEPSSKVIQNILDYSKKQY